MSSARGLIYLMLEFDASREFFRMTASRKTIQQFGTLRGERQAHFPAGSSMRPSVHRATIAEAALERHPQSMLLRCARIRKNLGGMLPGLTLGLRRGDLRLLVYQVTDSIRILGLRIRTCTVCDSNLAVGVAYNLNGTLNFLAQAALASTLSKLICGAAAGALDSKPGSKFCVCGRLMLVRV